MKAPPKRVYVAVTRGHELWIVEEEGRNRSDGADLEGDGRRDVREGREEGSQARMSQATQNDYVLSPEEESDLKFHAPLLAVRLLRKLKSAQSEVNELRLENERLHAEALVPMTSSPCGCTGDYDVRCSECGKYDLDEPHTWKECHEELKKQLDYQDGCYWDALGVATDFTDRIGTPREIIEHLAAEIRRLGGTLPLRAKP